MSDFAPLQHKRTKKTPSTMASFVPQAVRDFTPPPRVPDSETVSSPDWQANIAHTKQFGYSIGRLAIHRPDAKIDEEMMQQASLLTSKQASSIDGTLQLQQETQTVGISEQHQENRTGLPDALKAGVERLSGYYLNDIRVHYNSSKPAEVDALAYTQGTEIHVGTGQEEYLAHEAWHVVQQKQNRVIPMLQVKGVAINDDQELEREADRMGEKASKGKEPEGIDLRLGSLPAHQLKPISETHAPIQRMKLEEFHNSVREAAQKNIRPPEGIKGTEAEQQDIRVWIIDFLSWMDKEYQEWEAKGAFDSTLIKSSEDEKPQYKRMYSSMEEYIQDEAFTEKVFAFHLADYLSSQPTSRSQQQGNRSREDLHVEGMQALMQENLKWTNPVMPEGIKKWEERKPFYKWLFETEQKPTAMNCWEGVLYAACNAGIIDKNYIKKAISRDETIDPSFPRKIELVSKIQANPTGKQRKPEEVSKYIDIPIDSPIPKGHVVIFGYEGQHVALATGTIETIQKRGMIEVLKRNRGHGILEIDLQTGGVVQSTIEDTIEKAAYGNEVNWGPLPSL